MATSPATLHDPLLNPKQEFFNNPYAVLEKLRSEAPVFWSEKGEYWLVSRHADAHDILSDLQFAKEPRRFKQMDMLAKIFPQAEKLTGMRGCSMLNQNPPDHTRLRSLVNKAFTPKMISQMRPRIESIANELLDAVQAKGRMDVINDFAYPLPATVIAEMLGVPAKDRDKFKGWSHDITISLDPNPNPNLINIGKVAFAYNELVSYLKPLIEDRRHNRKDDLISGLVAAEEEGNKLSASEVIANIVLLLIAGHETTTNLIGNGTLALLSNPDQLSLLKSNPDLLPGAVQEILRYDSPVQIVRRIAAQDLEIGGQKISEGQTVLILIGCVNRDPAEFEDPHKFDITRTKNKNLAFGYGIHHCLGSSLAETEGQIALNLLFTRMPDLKLAQQNIEYKQPFSLRGLKSLQATF